MRTCILFAALLAFVQCTTSSSGEENSAAATPSIDPDFKMQYDNCIQIISLRQVDCKHVDCATDYWNAVYAFQCLHALTGVESNIIVNSDAPYFYPTTESKDFTEFFYEDLIRWNDWYEKNKLSVTKAKADSLLSVHSAKVGYEVKWPQPYTLIFSSNPPKAPEGPEGATTASGSE